MNPKQLANALNAHYIKALQAEDKVDSLAEFSGVLTGLLVALYEQVDDEAKQNALGALNHFGVDLTKGVSIEAILQVIQEDEELPDNVVRIH